MAQDTVDKGLWATYLALSDDAERTPTATVKIDWNNDGDFGDANEDISAYVKRITGKREIQESDPGILVKGAVAADCDIELKDAAHFSKDIATSPRHDIEIVNLPVQVSAGFSGNEVRIHTGNVRSLRATSASREASAYCFDKAERLKNLRAPTSLFANEPSDFLIEVMARLSGVNQGYPVSSHTKMYAPFRSSIGTTQGSNGEFTTGSLPIYATGQFGKAVNIQTSKCILWSTANLINLAAGSIGFWIKTDWAGNDGVSHDIFIDHTLTSPYFNYWIRKNFDGDLRLVTYIPEYQSIEIDVSALWTADEWHFIAVTWDVAGNTKLYFDGSTATGWPPGSMFGDYVTDADYMAIGNNPNLFLATKPDVNSIYGWPAPGLYEGFFIEDRALSTAQLDAINALPKTGAFDIAAGQNIISYAWQQENDVWADMAKLVEAEQGRVFYDEIGVLTFKNKYSVIIDADSVTSVATLAYNTNTMDIEIDESIENVYNKVSVAATPRVKAAGVTDLWAYGDDPPYLSAGASLTIWAKLDNPCAPSDYVPPAATTDYAGFTIPDGTGTDMTGSMTVVATTYAQSVKFVITNNHATTGLYVTLLKIRGKAITEAATITSIREDATSQTAYGIRTLEITNDYITTQAQADSLAAYYLEQYKNPTRRITGLQIKALPHLQLSDRITVDDTGYLGISGDYWIKAIGYEISESGYLMALDATAAEAREWGFYGISKYGTGLYTY